MLFNLLPLSPANLLAFCLLFITVLWRRYATKHARLVAYEKRDDVKGIPSTFPHVFPFLGSLPIMYLRSPKDFVLNPK